MINRTYKIIVKYSELLNRKFFILSYRLINKWFQNHLLILATVIIFIISSGNLKSQIKNNLDSVLSEINSQNTTEKLKSYSNLIEYHNRFMPEKSIIFSKTALLIARNNGFQKSESDILYLTGMSYYYQSDFIKSMEFHQLSLDIRKKLQYNVGIAQSLNRMSQLFEIRGEYDKALDYCLESINILEKENVPNILAEPYNNLGIIYYIMSDFKKAEEYLLKALKFCETINDSFELAIAHEHLGVLYIKTGDLDKALYHNIKSIELREIKNDRIGIAGSYGNQAIIYRKLKNYSEALKYYEKALNLTIELKDKRGTALSISGMGITYFNIGNYKKSIQYLKNAYEIRKQLGDKRGLVSSLNQMSETYALMKDYKQAIEYFKLAKIHNDSLQNEEKLRSHVRYEIKYTYEKQKIKEEKARAKEKYLTEIKNERNRIILYIILGLTLILLTVGSYYLKVLSNKNTELKKTKEELEKQKEIAENATAAKSSFLVQMSHEIRTPMNAILGLSHLALKTKLSNKQKDYLTKVESSSQALLGIINDILDFSKIEEAKLNIENIEFELEMVLDSVSNLIIQKAQEKNLEFTVLISKDVPHKLIGDPLRISQVITNYCSNAIKFTERGKITLSLDLLEDLEKSKGLKNKVKLQFSVKDTGIGIAEESRNKLFTKFTQAESSTTSKYGGTGLGLTISKLLSELMGGEVWFESELGKGSNFYFTAVLEKQSEQNFGVSSRLKKPERGQLFIEKIKKLKGKRVLLTEDNEINQQVAKELLEQSGFIVEIANNGAESVEMALSKEYSIVLMDLQMPIMDGYSATAEIRSQKNSKELPIVAMTADAMLGVEENCYKVGMQAYVTKPIDPDELFKVLSEWIKPSGKDTEYDNPEQNINFEKTDETTIPVIKNIDTENVIRRLGGNKRLYLSLLEKFYENNKNITEEIKTAYDNGDKEKSFRLAHTLKGVSGNIGAVRINKLASLVESEMRNGTKSIELSELENEIYILLNSIEEWLNSKKPEEIPEIIEKIDKELFSQKINELKQMLEGSEFNSINKLKEIQKLPGIYVYREEINKAIKLLNNFEFEETLTIIKKINVE